MEALQILKFGLKKKRLSFTEELVTSEDALAGLDPAIKGQDLLVEFLQRGVSGVWWMNDEHWSEPRSMIRSLQVDLLHVFV